MIKLFLTLLIVGSSSCDFVCQTNICRELAITLPNGSYYYDTNTQIPNSALLYPKGTLVDVSINTIVFWNDGTFVYEDGTLLGVEAGNAILPDGSIGNFPTPAYLALYPDRWPVTIIEDEDSEREDTLFDGGSGDYMN